MNAVLLEFEDMLARKPGEACKVLGVPYSTYAGYRASEDPLPSHLQRHIETLRMLEPGKLHGLIRERLRG